MSTTEDLHNKSMDRALDFLDKGNVMTDEQIEQMMSDDEVISDIHALMELKRATQASSPRSLLNVDAEWKYFESRHQTHAPRKKTIIRWSIMGIAATVALIVGVLLYAIWQDRVQEESIVLVAIDNPEQHPTLVTSNGHKIALNGEEYKSDLIRIGANTSATGMTMSEVGQKTADTLLLTIPRGQIYQLTLADGSEVWLNNECKLSYTSQFIGKERRVKIEGEAYFKVARDEQRPFIVEANGLETKVLGTEFNVRSYGRSDVHVTLIKGSVEVKTEQNYVMKLKPGQNAELNADGSLGIAEVDIESYIYWRDGYFYFDNITLESVMQDIGRWYNLNVIFRNKDARSYHMHFLADKQGGIDHVIELLNSLEKVVVTREENTLIIQ